MDNLICAKGKKNCTYTNCDQETHFFSESPFLKDVTIGDVFGNVHECKHTFYYLLWLKQTICLLFREFSHIQRRIEFYPCAAVNNTLPTTLNLNHENEKRLQSLKVS